MGKSDTASLTIAELREFASFGDAEQRFIERGINIAFSRGDAASCRAADPGEMAGMQAQHAAYRELRRLRGTIPDPLTVKAVDGFMAVLTRITAQDLVQERLGSFSAYRFLYERLLGAAVRPWLPAAFCGAAALPMIRPEWRKQLLQSLSEAAATAPAWSTREPSFYPEKVEAEAA